MSSKPASSQYIPLHVVLDFDGTITTEDTIGLLAEIATSRQDLPNREIQNKWAQILQSYIEDLSHHQQTFPNQTIGSLERTPSQEACLSSLTAVEHRSIKRVNASKIFQGVDSHVLREGAEAAILEGKIVVRDGFKELVEKACREGGRVGIVSVNWSREWIRAIIGIKGVDCGCNGEGDDSIAIMANQIDASSGEILGPPATLGWPIPSPSYNSNTDPESMHEEKEEDKKGEERKSLPLITTAASKLNALKILYLRSQYPPPPRPSNHPQLPRNRNRLIYIADSLTDLDCLLVADLPIIIPSPSTEPLKEELLKMGYEWRWVGEVREGWSREMDLRMLGAGGMGGGEREKVVLWAREFWEVLESKVFMG